MLADRIVAAAQDGFARGRLVELQTESVDTNEIAEIEHEGDGLVRYRYSGLPNDHFVPESRIVALRIRPPENEW